MLEETQTEVEDIELTRSKATLCLELIIRDSVVTGYLEGFEDLQRQEKALEAPKVGVIAIQSASSTLDTRVVEERFSDIEKKITGYITNFRLELEAKLDENFRFKSGAVPRSLDKFLGDDGTLRKLFDQYFSQEGGKVAQLLNDQVGPSSQFYKSLDPDSKESVISHIEEIVRKQLEENIKLLIGQFSPDIEDSALTKLRSMIAKEIENLRNENNLFFGSLREILGIKAGAETEAEKCTAKGRDFESNLYQVLANLGGQSGDFTENVSNIVGSASRSKKGDYVIELGKTSGAPGKRIVVKSRKSKAELVDAKENREESAGILCSQITMNQSKSGTFYELGMTFILQQVNRRLKGVCPFFILRVHMKFFVLRWLFRSEKKRRVNLTLMG
jgi:hypothetical protein